jgi:FtsH-binding integral membrane protein
VWAMMAAGVAICVWAAVRNTNPNYPAAVLWSVLAALVVSGTLLYAAARFSARKATVSSIQPPPSTRDPS